MRLVLGWGTVGSRQNLWSCCQLMHVAFVGSEHWYCRVYEVEERIVLVFNCAVGFWLQCR